MIWVYVAVGLVVVGGLLKLWVSTRRERELDSAQVFKRTKAEVKARKRASRRKPQEGEEV